MRLDDKSIKGRKGVRVVGSILVYYVLVLVLFFQLVIWDNLVGLTADSFLYGEGYFKTPILDWLLWGYSLALVASWIWIFTADILRGSLSTKSKGVWVSVISILSVTAGWVMLVTLTKTFIRILIQLI